MGAVAHELNCRMFAGCLVTGNVCQRIALFCNRHPRINTTEAMIYMSSYFLVFLMMFLSYF